MNTCKNHTMFYSSDCELCKKESAYNYLYNSECDRCKHQMAFQAFTKRECKICNKKHEHCNGNTPTICEDCLRPNQCRKCGKPIKPIAGGQNR